jgi:uncharacterized protein (TIGR02302 family)
MMNRRDPSRAEAAPRPAAPPHGAGTTAGDSGPSPWPLRLAWLVLAWERAARAFWPAAALAMVGLAALLSGLLPQWPGLVHLAVLVLLGAAVSGALLAGLRVFRAPTRTQALRRLEQAAPEGHRPRTALTDALAVGADDAVSRALWRAHRDSMRTRAAALRPGPPRPELAARDPMALRLAPLPLLFVAAVAAWPDLGGRLAAALSPTLGPPPAPVSARAWITPPDYTGAAPVTVRTDDSGATAAGDGAPIVVPEGSTLLVLVQGGRGAAVLDLSQAEPALMLAQGDAGGQRLSVTLGRPAAPDEGEAPGASVVVDSATRLRLTQDGRRLLDTPLTLRLDAAPVVAWTAPPGPAEGALAGRLALAYAARDDYGLESLSLTVAPAAGQVLGQAPTVDLPPTTGDDLRARQDLSAHPWAGTAVTLSLTATDARGQRASSEAAAVILPERRFNHPVAQAVVDIRRDLVMRPERARAAADGLHGLADDLIRREADRLAVFLTLKSAAAALALAPDGRARTADLKTLWDIAVALEDGSLQSARRDLTEAREALREALDRGADGDEIRRLSEALREAMDRLMSALAETMPLARLPMDALPPGAEAMPFDPQAVERMLEEMEALSELGAEEAARAMLDQLDSMLRQLESARPPSRAEMQALAEMADIMARLRDLVERQQALHDETFRLDPRDPGQSRPGQSGPGLGQDRPLPPMRPGESLDEWMQRQAQPPPGAGRAPGEAPPSAQAMRDLETLQRALRQALESLMADLADRLSDVPETLGEANLAMREAERALRNGDAAAAAEAQGRALEALTEGQGQAMSRMMGPGGQPGRGQGQGPGFGFLPMMPGGGQPGMMPGGPGRGQGMGRDPLNRPVRGGGPDDGSVRVPTEPETRRAHDILRELRRRANEAEQGAPDRDYLDRLLDAF